MFDARVEQVIITELELRGEGVEGDPIRRIKQCWSFSGELLFERDVWKEEHEKRQLQKKEKEE